jgi:3-vinyl bacteriochlorophyllide hydratase
MYITLAAYTAYVINATQWILKLRAARLLEESERAKSAAAEAATSFGSAGVPA